MPKNLNYEINKEYESEKSLVSKANINEWVLAPFLPYRLGNGPKEDDLTKRGLFGKRPSREAIKNAYAQVSKQLSTKYQAIRTRAEYHVSNKVALGVKYRPIPSYWMGPYCFDLFFPQISTPPYFPKRGFHGLVIEVDGGIHHSESKMKKDESKLRELARRGICLASIPNDKINEFDLIKTFKVLRGFYCPDHRKKQRLLTRIQTWTLLTHLKTKDIETLFCLEKGDLERLRGLFRPCANLEEPISYV